MWIFNIYHHSCYLYGVSNLLRSSKSVCKNTGNLSAVYFRCSFGIFWESGTDIQKSLCQSLIDIHIHIYQLVYISLLFYNAGFGCKYLSKMTTIRPRTRIDGETLCYENCYPWHIFKHKLWKPKKARYLKL